MALTAGAVVLATEYRLRPVAAAVATAGEEVMVALRDRVVLVETEAAAEQVRAETGVADMAETAAIRATAAVPAVPEALVVAVLPPATRATEETRRRDVPTFSQAQHTTTAPASREGRWSFVRSHNTKYGIVQPRRVRSRGISGGGGLPSAPCRPRRAPPCPAQESHR